MRTVLDTSARLLRLLGLLQSHREWSGTGLADELGVSCRTVRRDVDKLRLLGYPITAIGGVGGGYQLAAGASLPPLLLDDDEAVAVAVGLRTATSGTITGIAETSVRALAKLDQVLPSRLRYQVNTISSAVLSMPHAGPTVDSSTLTEIATAIRDSRRLRFDYVAGDGRDSAREAEPYRLVNNGRRWYLFCWDVHREDWRTFRVDRLRLRTPGGPRFTAREMPADDLAAYLVQNLSRSPYRYQARLTMHGSAAQVSAEVPPSIGVVEPVDERTCTLRIGSDDLDHLAVWIAAFGFDFDIHEPPELAEHMRTLAARMQRAAGSATNS